MHTNQLRHRKLFGDASGDTRYSLFTYSKVDQAIAFPIPMFPFCQMSEEDDSIQLKHNIHFASSYLCAVFMTRWTVRPSLMPCWLRESPSFSIFPAKIRTNWSCLALNLREISSLNWERRKIYIERERRDGQQEKEGGRWGKKGKQRDVVKQISINWF